MNTTRVVPALAILLWGVGAAPAEAASVPYYFSHLVFSGGWQTTLTFVNYSPQTITCVTNFYSDLGAGLPVQFSEGIVTTRTDVLQPGQTVHDETIANPSATVVQGWAVATCTGPLQASLLYRYYQAGTALGEASVLPEAAPTTAFMTFAQTATGVAWANPSTTQAAQITFEAYSASGSVLATAAVTVVPLGHGSKNLNALLGLPSFLGSVKITSTIPILSLSLNAEAFPSFSSLPAGDLPGGTALVTP